MVAKQNNDLSGRAKKPWSAPRLADLDNTGPGEKQFLNVVEFMEGGVPDYTTNTAFVS